MSTIFSKWKLGEKKIPSIFLFLWPPSSSVSWFSEPKKQHFHSSAAVVKASTHYVRLSETDRSVHVCAHVQAGFLFAGPGSEEGPRAKDHKKCVTADSFRLLIKIC